LASSLNVLLTHTHTFYECHYDDYSEQQFCFFILHFRNTYPSDAVLVLQKRSRLHHFQSFVVDTASDTFITYFYSRVSTILSHTSFNCGFPPRRVVGVKRTPAFYVLECRGPRLSSVNSKQAALTAGTLGWYRMPI